MPPTVRLQNTAQNLGALAVGTLVGSVIAFWVGNYAGKTFTAGRKQVRKVTRKR
jgi:membrane protein DedA with SNARE-associated domain